MLQQNHHHHHHNSSHHQVVSSPHPSTTAGVPTGNLIANPNNQGVQFYNQSYSLISINQLKQQQQQNNQAHVHSFNPAPVNSGVNSQVPVTAKSSESSVDGQLEQQQQHHALQGSNNVTGFNEIDSDDSIDTDDEELDEINRTERHVYVTFDVTNQAAQLLKKLATDNFHRLREIGIRSVKLKSEPETIKITKRLKRESIVSSQNHEAANNTNLQPILPPQQQFPKGEPLTMPNQIMAQTQQLPLVNPSAQQSVNPTTKKRNRKTINELTSSPNYLEASQQQKMSVANYQQQQHTHHVPSQGSVDTNRNLKLEESLKNLQNKPQSTEAENSQHPQQHTIQQQYHQQQQPHQPKQFYQIDKDGNVVAHTSNSNIIQFNPANQKQSTQLPQQPQPIVVAQQNYPNNPGNMTNNRGPYNQYANQPGQNLIQQPQQQQMHRPPPQQPGMQPHAQQYRMPSPMLANLLSNSSSPQIASGNDMYNNGSMSVPNSTQPNNNNPVMIRQMSNNYEYVNTNNVNSMNPQQQNMNYQGQPQNNDAIKQQQPDFNLMKSEDYKHIYQMRQQFASQAGPNQIQHHQQQMLNQNPTMPVIPTGNAVLSPVAGPATTAAAAPGTTPTKRKRAPADPNKPKTKRAKANAAAGLIRNNSENNLGANMQATSTPIHQNNMSPGMMLSDPKNPSFQSPITNQQQPHMQHQIQHQQMMQQQHQMQQQQQQPPMQQEQMHQLQMQQQQHIHHQLQQAQIQRQQSQQNLQHLQQQSQQMSHQKTHQMPQQHIPQNMSQKNMSQQHMTQQQMPQNMPQQQISQNMPQQQIPPQQIPPQQIPPQQILPQQIPPQQLLQQQPQNSQQIPQHVTQNPPNLQQSMQPQTHQPIQHQQFTNSSNPDTANSEKIKTVKNIIVNFNNSIPISNQPSTNTMTSNSSSLVESPPVQENTTISNPENPIKPNSENYTANANSQNVGDSFVNSQLQSPNTNATPNHDTSSNSLDYLNPMSSAISSSSTNNTNGTNQAFLTNQPQATVIHQQQNSYPSSTCQPSSSTNMLQANELINQPQQQQQKPETVTKTGFLTEDTNNTEVTKTVGSDSVTNSKSSYI